MTMTALVALDFPYLFALLLVLIPRTIHGHGQLTSPRSRNWVAHQDGTWDTLPGIPPSEYCYHCLNRNAGVCGLSGKHNYDEWLDSQGNPMPWTSQDVYTAGDIITLQTTLDTHHGGHAEFRICAVDDEDASTTATTTTTATTKQECFDQNHPLIFVKDLLHNMPADPQYPERGYYAGWNTNTRDFAMQFQLPAHVYGQQVLLQWRYITANSCSPPGYHSYFQGGGGGNSQARILPTGFWADRLSPCQLPYPADGTVGKGAPEQFWNCAEITILPPPPTVSPAPTTDLALSSESPTLWTSASPTNIVTRKGPKQDSRTMAYLGNWQSCPSSAQLQQYSHVVIAFAVSYTWNAAKNNCSPTCQIDTPPVCNNAPNPTLIQSLRREGKKVLLSFGGAGMGGSWEGDVNDCWDSCFGRAEQVVDRLVEIVNEMDLDGVDIDYEYFYEDNQNGSGFARGAEAIQFLKSVTLGLRRKLPLGSVVTHAPMDADLVEGTAYFDLVKELSDVIDFIMPQYYNGVTRPVKDGFENANEGQMAASVHYKALVDTMFHGDATKVVFGFCINDCAGTGSNSNAVEAAALMTEIGEIYDCHGGAFFWNAEHDSGGSWSSTVNRAMDDKRGCSGGLVVIPTGTDAPTPVPPPPSQSPTTSNPVALPTVSPTITFPDDPTKSPTIPSPVPTPNPTVLPPKTPSPTRAPSDPAPPTDDSVPCCPYDYTGLRALSSCTKFHYCVNGRVTSDPVPCAAGTLFDPILQICNWADQVTCVPGEPCFAPSASPSIAPSPFPTAYPSSVPSLTPSVEPSLAPSPSPTLRPTSKPSQAKTPSALEEPSSGGTNTPETSREEPSTEGPVDPNRDITSQAFSSYTTFPWIVPPYILMIGSLCLLL